MGKTRQPAKPAATKSRREVIISKLKGHKTPLRLEKGGRFTRQSVGKTAQFLGLTLGSTQHDVANGAAPYYGDVLPIDLHQFFQGPMNGPAHLISIENHKTNCSCAAGLLKSTGC